MLNDAVSENILRFHEHYSCFPNTLKGVSTVSGVRHFLAFRAKYLFLQISQNTKWKPASASRVLAAVAWFDAPSCGGCFVSFCLFFILRCLGEGVGHGTAYMLLPVTPWIGWWRYGKSQFRSKCRNRQRKIKSNEQFIRKSTKVLQVTQRSTLTSKCPTTKSVEA